MKAKAAPDPQAAGLARVEFMVSFSRGPRGRRRVVEGSTVVAAAPEPAPAAQPRPESGRSPAGPVGEEACSRAPVALKRRALAPAPAALSASAPLPPPENVPKATRLLVLGHYFERLIRDGKVKDYAEIARLTGLSRARVAQITNLTLLAPEIQDEILSTPWGTDGRLHHERTLRMVVTEPDWTQQRRLLGPRGLG